MKLLQLTEVKAVLNSKGEEKQQEFLEDAELEYKFEEMGIIPKRNEEKVFEEDEYDYTYHDFAIPLKDYAGHFSCDKGCELKTKDGEIIFVKEDYEQIITKIKKLNRWLSI